MEYQKTYDGEGLKGALWTLAGTSIFNAATKNGGCGNVLGNLLGNGCGCNGGGAFAMAEATISALQADNARLRSEKYADNKVQEFYNYFVGREEKLADELCRTRTRLAVAENEIATFKSLTVTRIPNSMLCPGVPAVEVVHPTTAAAGA
jgi:hypothetical protein